MGRPVFCGFRACWSHPHYYILVWHRHVNKLNSTRHHFIASFLITYFKRQAANLDTLEERVKKLEEHINYMEKVAALDKRLALIEVVQGNKTKKGVVDPRIVILVILIFLLYLYLRNTGLLG